MIAVLLLCLAGTPEENEVRLQKEIDAYVAKHAAKVQEGIDDHREHIKRLTKSDKAKAKQLRDTIADLEKHLKYFVDPKHRPKTLTLNESKLKIGAIGRFGDDFDYDQVQVRVVRVIDKTTFIARKPRDAPTLYLVENYPTKKLEEGETTLLRGMYEVVGLDPTRGSSMWMLRPFPLPEPVKK